MEYGLNEGIWDPKLRGTNIKGTNLKSLKIGIQRTGEKHKFEFLLVL